MTDHVDNPLESLATLSICTGIRGLERGVERVTGPLRTIAYVEVEAFIIENLLVGMEAGLLVPAPIWANLKTFPWEQFRGKVGLLMGGYPCQPFSTAGLRKGEDDPRHLWPYIEHGIRTTRPICCFFENVGGHLTLGFEQVAHSLRSMGYAVEAGIFTAEEVGAPHKRARLFILAILADTKSERSGEARRFFERFKEWSARPGEELADAKHSERRTFDIWRNRIDSRQGTLHGFGAENSGGFAKCGQEMAHTDSDGSGTDAGIIGNSSQADEGETQRQERHEEIGERGGPNLGDRSTDVANSDLRRQQQWFDTGMGRIPQSFPWPAGPGQEQYAWECSRTIEPGMGSAINGYNFREDLLRALGNGVVEQTVEIAFRDLLRKHFA